MASAFDDALKNAKGTHFLICPWRRQTFSEDFQNPQRHSTLSTFVPKGFFFIVRRSTTSRSSISRRRVRIRPRSGDCRRPTVVGLTRFISNLSQPLAIRLHERESAAEFSEIGLDLNVDGSTYAPKCAGSKCAPKSRSGSVRTIIGDAARDLRHREPRPATTSSPRSRSRALRRLSAKSMTSANLHPGSSPPTSGSLSRDSIRYDGLLYSTMNRD